MFMVDCRGLQHDCQGEFGKRAVVVGAYQKIVAGLLFPIHERLKGHDTLRVFRELERSQWLPPADVDALQLRNLRDFLQRIGAEVPYYRQLFQRLRFDPGAITSIADLGVLPLADKALIKTHTEELKSLAGRALQRFNTGGSSGAPLVFYLGAERVSHDVAAKRRATRWWGVDIGDPEIVVWGSPIELGAQDRIRQIRDHLFRSELLSAFEMSQANLDRFVDRIRRRRPAMLFGYPSSLSLIARHAVEAGVDLDECGTKVAFVTSERLYPHQRKVIESVFGCPVANGYGGRDAGFIAHECPQGSLHITAEDLVVEIVDGDGRALPPGESGEIVVTHLFTSDFPFVRYRTGDVGSIGVEACACGRGLPVLASVEGRSTDFVVAADGTRMHGLALIYVLRDIDAIEEFRIVQESMDRTRVQLVAPDADREQLSLQIRTSFRERLGDSVDVDVEYVSVIPRERSGKHRYVVSHVRVDG